VHRRQTKFTPTNIRQIINLLERGRSKEEIAEIIGVTPATLQVTCSKLGISLRRPSCVAAGVSRPPLPQKSHLQELNEETAMVANHDKQFQLTPEAVKVDEDHTIIHLHPNQLSTENLSSNGVLLTIRYNGEERAINVPVDRNALGMFALEAEFRSASIGELIGQALASIAKNDLFKSVLDGHPLTPRNAKDQMGNNGRGGEDQRGLLSAR
jgi:hypothetical protein